MTDKMNKFLERPINNLPSALYRRLALKSIRITDSELSGVTFKVAETLEEHELSFRLVHDMYVARGISKKDPSGIRFSAFHVLPTTTTFIAKRDDRVIGTVSLIEDSPIGLPMEKTHPEEILSLRLDSRRFAEVGALAVEKGHRGRGVSLMLYNILFRWARQHRFIESLVIAVHPGIAKFYEDVLLFQRIGPTRYYESLNKALSTPLLLELSSATTRFRAIYEHHSMRLGKAPCGNLYSFFSEHEFPSILLPESVPFSPRIHCVPEWCEQDFLRFIETYSVDVASLPRQHQRVLMEFYPSLKTLPRHRHAGARHGAADRRHAGIADAGATRRPIHAGT